MLAAAPGTMPNQCEAFGALAEVIFAPSQSAPLPASEPKGVRAAKGQPLSPGKYIEGRFTASGGGRAQNQRTESSPFQFLQHGKIPLRSGITSEAGAKQNGVKKSAGVRPRLTTLRGKARGQQNEHGQPGPRGTYGIPQAQGDAYMLHASSEHGEKRSHPALAGRGTNETPVQAYHPGASPTFHGPSSTRATGFQKVPSQSWHRSTVVSKEQGHLRNQPCGSSRGVPHV